MPRLKTLDPNQLSEAQNRVYQEIAGARGGVVAGPFGVWLRQPALADRMNQLGNLLRIDGRLGRRRLEIIVLSIARLWTAQYMWSAHESQALAAGLDPEIIAAIRQRQAPVFHAEEDRILYLLTHELSDARTLSEPTYQRALELLGEDLLIEAVSVIGFYTTAAMVINAFDAEVPGGARPLA